jgi:hypothetical protein
MAHARRERSKTIFVPLQVQRDSNILLHSKHVKTMRQLVVEAINLRDRHFPDYRILVRPHPEEDPEETLNLPIAKGTHITSQGNLNDILSDSEVTVTVNSTVGLEAALYGNLPIVYGEGIYTREPFVFRCGTGADGSPAEQLKFLREAPEQVWQQVSDFMIALLDRNLVQPLRCTVSDPEQLLKSFPVADLQVLPARSPYLEKARAEFEQVEGMVHCHVLSSDFPPTNLDYRRMRSVPTSSDLNRMLGAILMTDKQFLAKRGAWSSAFHVAIADEDVSQETTSNYKIVFTPSFGLHPSFLKANCLVLSS